LFKRTNGTQISFHFYQTNYDEVMVFCKLALEQQLIHQPGFISQGMCLFPYVPYDCMTNKMPIFIVCGPASE